MNHTTLKLRITKKALLILISVLTVQIQAHYSSNAAKYGRKTLIAMRPTATNFQNKQPLRAFIMKAEQNMPRRKRGRLPLITAPKAHVDMARQMAEMRQQMLAEQEYVPAPTVSEVYAQLKAEKDNLEAQALRAIQDQLNENVARENRRRDRERADDMGPVEIEASEAKPTDLVKEGEKSRWERTRDQYNSNEDANKAALVLLTSGALATTIAADALKEYEEKKAAREAAELAEQQSYNNFMDQLEAARALAQEQK